jgi:hypothetical protein
LPRSRPARPVGLKEVEHVAVDAQRHRFLGAGSDGAGAAGNSGGLVVAALNAFSASERESPIARRAMPPP